MCYTNIKESRTKKKRIIGYKVVRSKTDLNGELQIYSEFVNNRFILRRWKKAINITYRHKLSESRHSKQDKKWIPFFGMFKTLKDAREYSRVGNNVIVKCEGKGKFFNADTGLISVENVIGVTYIRILEIV